MKRVERQNERNDESLLYKILFILFLVRSEKSNVQIVSTLNIILSIAKLLYRIFW